MPVRRKLTAAQRREWLKHYEYPSLTEVKEEYGLSVETPDDSPLVEKAMLVPRCGNAFRRAGNANVKLMTNRPLIFFEEFLEKQFTVEAFVKEVMDGYNLWTAVCDIKFDRTSDRNKAHIVIKTELIDGPGQTLAYAYFPSGTRMQLPCVFAEEEAWDTPFGPKLRSTAGHEGGHNMGFDHDPSGKGLMAAFYNADIQVPTSSWEFGQAQSRYGKAVPATPTLPPTTGNEETINIRVSGRGLKVVGYEKVK